MIKQLLMFVPFLFLFAQAADAVPNKLNEQSTELNLFFTGSIGGSYQSFDVSIEVLKKQPYCNLSKNIIPLSVDDLNRIVLKQVPADVRTKSIYIREIGLTSKYCKKLNEYAWYYIVEGNAGRDELFMVVLMDGTIVRSEEQEKKASLKESKAGDKAFLVKKLESIKINCAWKKKPLREILAIIDKEIEKHNTGKNEPKIKIMATKKASSGLFTFNVKNISIYQLLNSICVMNNIRMEIEGAEVTLSK